MTRAAVDRTPAPPRNLNRDISATLERFISRKRADFALLGPDVTPLFDLASQAVAGGKRLRPAFAYWGWRAAGGSATDTEAITTAAAAVELVHASALIHDDVIDGSATRRGRRSTQQEFAALLPGGAVPSSGPPPPEVSNARSIGRPPPDKSVEATGLQFGSSAAILLGDLLLSWSDELLATSGFKPKVAARGRRYFDLLRGEVVAGQYLDVLGQASDRSTAADAMRVVRYKSAKYTVERPLQFGAALAKAGEPLLTALSSYGVPLGEAFQLRDDVLGVFGETQVTGKPSGDDLREGKRTLLLARAFDEATAEQAAVLKEHVGDSTLDAGGIAAVQQVLRDTGALTNVEAVIAHLKSASLAALESAPITDQEAVEALRSLADQATNRSL
ncbi:MAG: polyprenyl synthetase family protein [Propionibacteriales bacterium]|nr:polyprenyl synthetase family protein [Propionibacteriales bacterium]